MPIRKSPWQLAESEWQACRHLFAGRRKSVRGRPRNDDTRRVVEAVLFHHFHNLAPASRSAGWNQLPPALRVSPATANRRYREWVSNGTWNRFWDLLTEHRADETPKRRSQERGVELTSPVTRIVQELERAHQFFNDRFFWGSLPTTVLTVNFVPTGRTTV